MATPFVVFIVSLAIFAVNINSFPLRNWDEAWYAEIIKNMASGQYSLLVPFWNGQYYFDKPPLYFWLSLPFVEFFGIGEWQTRIVSVLAAATAALLVFLIGKKLFDSTTGIISSIIFVTLGQVYFRFSHGNLDALLVALFLATFYSFLFSDKKITASLCGIFLGLGFLVKGWTLGLLPLFLILVSSLVVEKKLPRNLGIIFGTCLVTAGWWYLLGNARFGVQFVHWYLFIIAEGSLNISLFSLSLEPLRFLVRDLGIWLLPVLVYLIKVGTKDLVKQKTLVTFGIVLLSFLLILGFTSEKADWHNLLVYPFVALIAGYMTQKLYKIYSGNFLFVIVFFILLQIFIAYKIENLYPDRSRVGALLGQKAEEIIPKGATVVLNDRDFTSFLYYSDIGQILVIWPEKIEAREWWFVKKEALPALVEKHKTIWLVSPNPERLDLIEKL